MSGTQGGSKDRAASQAKQNNRNPSVLSKHHVPNQYARANPLGEGVDEPRGHAEPVKVALRVGAGFDFTAMIAAGEDTSCY